MDTNTYGARAAAMPAFMALRTPRPSSLRKGLTAGSSEARARATGKVTTLFGRVRWIAGLDSKNAKVRGNAERQAINAPVQGTAADLMKLSMIRLNGKLARLNLPARLLLQVNDELILEVAQAAVDDVAALARSVMEGITRLRVPLRVDVGTGTSWASAKG